MMYPWSLIIESSSKILHTEWQQTTLSSDIDRVWCALSLFTYSMVNMLVLYSLQKLTYLQILISLLLHACSASLRWYPIGLFHPSLVALQDVVSCWQTHAAYSFKMHIVSNNPVLYFMQLNCIFLTDHLNNRRLLLLWEYTCSSSLMWPSFNSTKDNFVRSTL